MRRPAGPQPRSAGRWESARARHGLRHAGSACQTAAKRGRHEPKCNHSDRGRADPGESAGVAAREFPLVGGFADYLLFVNGQAVGVLEAKAKGITLGGVSEQTYKYLDSVPNSVPHVCDPLPFGYESSGVETFFRDLREPDSRSRRTFAFHKPETLQGWLSQQDTLRARLRDRSCR